MLYVILASIAKPISKEISTLLTRPVDHIVGTVASYLVILLIIFWPFLALINMIQRQVDFEELEFFPKLMRCYRRVVIFAEVFLFLSLVFARGINALDSIFLNMIMINLLGPIFFVTGAKLS